MRAALLAGFFLAACSSHASESDCDRATDRMIDIFTAPHVPEVGKVSTEAQKNAATWAKLLKERDPTKATLMQACRAKMSSDHASCVLKASDETTLAACLE
jgi:hypothetical protein